MSLSPDTTQRRRRLWTRPAWGAALLLIVPLMGNLYWPGWNWAPRGFVLVGGILFGLGLVYELASRNAATAGHRAAVGIALGTSLILVWGNFVQAADDVNPAGLIFLCVPLLAIAGSVLSRLLGRGMAGAMMVTAMAQALILVGVLAARNPETTPWTPALMRGVGGNVMCVLLYAASAWLFQRATRAALTERAMTVP